MKITFVLPHAGLAGGIRVVAIYAERLQRRGHDVTVVSTPWMPPGRRGRAWSKLRKILYRLNPFSDSPLDPSHFDDCDVHHIKIAEPRPVGEFDIPDSDVVVATWWQTASWVNALPRSKGAKAYFVQDYGAHEGQPLEEVARTWTLPMRKIVISKWLLRLVHEHCGSDCRADYVPNAVDLNRFNAPVRSKQAVPTVGLQYNPAPQKGCDIMVRAIELARRRLPRLDVISYGPSNSQPHAPLPNGTEHHMYARDDELAGIYQRCDAWLFGSRLEGFGLPILEAMACRTPVIATPAGAAPELIAGGGGKLVKHDDPQSMAEAICDLINLPDSRWQIMSQAAHETATSYTWEDATGLFEESLRRAIDGADRGSAKPQGQVAVQSSALNSD